MTIPGIRDLISEFGDVTVLDDALNMLESEGE